MPNTFQLYVDGAPVDAALTAKIAMLEVEENADMPGAIQVTLPVDRTEQGELSAVSESAFKPLANVAVTATAGTSPLPECIFDGVVLAQKLHLESGIVHSSVKVWGQDYSWMMNLEEKGKEWLNLTDALVASSIFGTYGIAPAPDNTSDDSPTHTEQGHSLMQRGTDANFLRDLARRNGKLFRVAGGNLPGIRIGYFSKPKLDGTPTATLKLSDPTSANIAGAEIDWDVSRPTAVKASQKLFGDPSSGGVSGDASSSGLSPISDRDLASFAGKPMTVMLTTTVDDGGELSMRSKALLGESGWFVRFETETDLGKLGVVPRVGQLFAVEGLGSLHSGTYYLWSARHTIEPGSHKVRMVLVRNAIGPEPSGGGGLGGLL